MFDLRRAGARHLLRHAVDDRQRSAATSRRRRSASSGTPTVRRGAADARCSTSVPPEFAVWASHGDFVARAPAGFAVVATSANAPVAAMAAIRRGGSTRCCSIPRSCTPSTALEILRNFAYRRLRLHAATGRWRRSSTRRSSGSDAQVGDGRVVCGAERRRRFDRRRAAHPPRDRRPADLHLRRQRRAAARRGGAGPHAVRAARAAARVRRRVASCSSSGWPASPIPSRSGRSSARTFIDVFEAEAREARAGSTSWRRARSIRT